MKSMMVLCIAVACLVLVYNAGSLSMRGRLAAANEREEKLETMLRSTLESGESLSTSFKSMEQSYQTAFRLYKECEARQ